MSNGVDPHWPGARPEAPNDLTSDAPAQPQGTTGVEPNGATAQPGSFDDVDSSPQSPEPPLEDFSTASGPPLPPVIEAFPGFHGVKKPPTPAVGAESPPAGARQKRWILLGATIAVVFTVVGVIGYMIANNNTASRPPPAAKPPPAAVLDGIHRLDIDGAKKTSNGAPAPSPGNASSWWAFRSTCTSTGCVATATKLDDTNQQVAATPPHTAELHFVNGSWQRTPARDRYPHERCLADGKFGPGEDTAATSWSAEPQPDRSLRGVWTLTVLTDECGFAGTVSQAPLVAVRTGDVPPTVTVADPATITATSPTPSPVPPVAGVTPVLDGTFRVEYEYAKQTANGRPTTGDPTPDFRWWAFRSLCTSAGCIATGAKLAKENHEAPAGGAMVLRFVDGHWQQPPDPMTGHGCPGNKNPQATTDDTFEWSLEPQPDGTLRGTDTEISLSNECGNQGKVYRTPLSVTRTGDVPAAVVLADPSLF